MLFTISNEFLTATINSNGAELTSLTNKNREYIWEGNPKFWGKHSPILFPIVGTLKDSFYLYENKKYELNRHGFARDYNFEMEKKSVNKVLFSLKSNLNTRKQYPFDFELQISYTLNNFDLEVSYRVLNQQIKDIPFSIGAHPAFALPKKMLNYSLLFEKQEVLKSFTLKNDLLSDIFFEIELKEKMLPLNYEMFKNDALIFKTIESKKITILENNSPLLSLSFSDFNNFGIWTKPNAPFICLEPWLGYSDLLNHNHAILEKEGIQIIKENCTFEISFTISLFKNASN